LGGLRNELTDHPIGKVRSEVGRGDNPPELAGGVDHQEVMDSMHAQLLPDLLQ
jgi:hypothetical protein